MQTNLYDREPDRSCWWWLRRGQGERKGLHGHEETLGGVMAMFIIFIVFVSQAYAYVKIYQSVHFKHVHFLLCQFNKAPLLVFFVSMSTYKVK